MTFYGRGDVAESSEGSGWPTRTADAEALRAHMANV